MMKMLLLLSLSLVLQAAMPKTYASIGDGIYNAIGPVRTLASYKTFRSDQKVFQTYINDAEAAKKEGFWLDSHRSHPEAKQRSEAYLKRLRHLQNVNAQITDTVRTKTMRTIEKHQTSTYFAIKKSGYPALIEDPDFKRASQRFENRLASEQKRAQVQKQKEAAAFLRSYDNLKGEWHSDSLEDKKIVYRFFDQDRISIVKRSSARTQTLEGTWQIKNDVMYVALSSITNRNTGSTPHQRATDAKIELQIRAIGKEKMTLFDPRRKEVLTFLR